MKIKVDNMVSFVFKGSNVYGTVKELDEDFAKIEYTNPSSKAFETAIIAVNILTLISTHPRIIERNKY